MSGPVGVFPVVLAGAVKVLICCHPPPKIMTFHGRIWIPSFYGKMGSSGLPGPRGRGVLTPGTLGGAWGHLCLS